MLNTSCLNYSFAALTITGLWVHRKVPKNVYYAYSLIFHLLFFFPMYYMELSFFSLSFSGSIEDIMSASTFLLLHTFQIVKTCIYHYKYEKIENLIHEINGHAFTRTEVYAKNILLKSWNKIKLHNQILFLLICITATIFAICPLLESTISLPFKYPLMSTQNKTFWCIYVYQILSIVFSGFSQISLDFLIGALIFIVASEVQLLSYEMTAIGKHETRKENGFVTDYDLMTNCVIFYQKIISVVQKMNDIFGYFLLFQFFCSCLAICTTNFTLSVMKDSLKLLPIYFYLACVLFQLWIYCYYGETLKTESENLFRQAYFCDWYKKSVKTQKLLLVLTMRARRVLTINAGGLLELSLENYSKILKTSYSYYSVLSNTNS